MNLSKQGTESPAVCVEGADHYFGGSPSSGNRLYLLAPFRPSLLISRPQILVAFMAPLLPPQRLRSWLWRLHG